MDGPPLPDGVLTVQSGRILAVEPKGTRTADENLGNVALIPGLVNAHTHLDLSGARGQIPPSPDFTGWLRQVTAHRGRAPAQVNEDIDVGVKEAMSFATTLVGDISVDGASALALGNAGLRGTVFHEILGLREERARVAWDKASAWLRLPSSTDRLRKALSPHAPYSVNRWLFEQAAEHRSLPIAIHLGETREELELLGTRSGTFKEFLEQLNAWQPEQLASSLREIMGMFPPENLLVIHANYLNPAQIPRGASVVYCPRTHAAFGHDPHPFREFLKAGIRVALGTDSLASNPDLDIFAEAQFVHRRHPEFDGAELLRMVTLSGAEALGWAEQTGSLTPGKFADLAVMPLPDAEGEPQALLFASTSAGRRTMSGGEWR